MIAHESERLAGILDDLLVATRLDTGTMSLSIGHCDGRRLVEEIVALEREAAPAEFELAVVADEETPEVACDQERLRQVLMNLVENAIKYSPGEVVSRSPSASTTGVFAFRSRTRGSASRRTSRSESSKSSTDSIPD